MCNCRRFMNPPATGGAHYIPTRYEEMANVGTHVLGIFASIFAIYHLLSMVRNHFVSPLCEGFSGHRGSRGSQKQQHNL